MQKKTKVEKNQEKGYFYHMYIFTDIERRMLYYTPRNLTDNWSNSFKTTLHLFYLRSVCAELGADVRFNDSGGAITTGHLWRHSPYLQ